MTETREHLLHWLRDAYAMEKQAIEMLEKQAQRAHGYSDLKQQIMTHLEETKNQVGRLERCLDTLGETPSAFKGGMGKLAGSLQAIGGMFAADEVVKSAMSGYVFEHYEIGNYRILITAAEAAGETEIAQLCRTSLKEETAMAKWLEDHLDDITEQFLMREEADKKARA